VKPASIAAIASKSEAAMARSRSREIASRSGTRASGNLKGDRAASNRGLESCVRLPKGQRRTGTGDSGVACEETIACRPFPLFVGIPGRGACAADVDDHTAARAQRQTSNRLALPTTPGPARSINPERILRIWRRRAPTAADLRPRPWKGGHRSSYCSRAPRDRRRRRDR